MKTKKAYLAKYLETLRLEQRKNLPNIVVDYFCGDEVNANYCADLILRGEKTATCSMKYWYESGIEPMPKIGNLQIVTDWNGNPTSIIETTAVLECMFSQVTAEFAAAEGEGDKSLSWWRQAHWNFFSTEYHKEGIQPSTEMFLVLERFKVVYT